MSWGSYPSYPSRPKKDPQVVINKLRKKYPDLAPIVIEGRTIAKTWWGSSWTKNLERYSDYSNRLPRGRSYLKQGNVVDLRIDRCFIEALVVGSEVYQVGISITPVSQEKWRQIIKSCGNKISGLEQLCEGKFPQEFADLFTSATRGLFPMQREIEFECSCPDSAHMCKHVAAVLYGVGARFDEDPLLFFKLRNIPFDQLLAKSVELKMQSLLKNSETKTDRVITDDEAAKLFGAL